MAGVEKVENGGDFGVGIVTKQEYRSYKKRALKLEQNNRRFILVIPCDGDKGWCEIGDNSALIYKYKVCLPLGVAVTFRDDYDSYYSQFAIGKIKTRGFEAVRERLKKSGLYAKEEKREKCVIFMLKQSLTEEEMDEIRKEEAERQAAMGVVVKVDFMDPVLYQKMVEIATRLHRICYSKMDKLSSRTNGTRIVKIIDEMVRGYFEINMELDKQTPEQVIERLETIKSHTYQLIVELQLVAGLKLWTRVECAEIGADVVQIKNRIEAQIRREKKERKIEIKNRRNNKEKAEK